MYETPTSPAATLELRGVSKVYGTGSAQVHALRGASLSVAAGSMVAVMGPSGSGKSTLLTIAGSLEEPTSGAVLVEGAPLSAMSRSAKARLRRAHDRLRVPGFQPAARAHRGGERGVAAGARRRARPARPGRGPSGSRRAGPGRGGGSLPGRAVRRGRQRVAIARAVVGERRLLLADEPSGALDSENGRAVIGLIRDACRHEVAAVVVTHDAQLAARADRVVYLRDGILTDRAALPDTPQSLLIQGEAR